jgi:Flp pilus assembly protein TadG
MLRPAAVCRRFIASRRGMAAIEFAMVLPFLLILFLASFDAGNAIGTYMKVRAATYTLAAITNQYQTIQSTDMTTITGATSAVFAPYASAPAIVTISQIKATSASQAQVNWSYSPTAGQALAQGSAVTNLPANFGQNTCGSTFPCYVIMATVRYTYTPTFGYFITGTLTLSDALYATPRSSTCVQYPPQNVTTC